MKKHGVGFIGAGGLRQHLGDYVHALGRNIRVVAGADINPAVFPQFRERYQRDGSDIFCTEDYRILLARDDVDSVFIISPDFCHEEQACAALEAGKSVYLEKPLAITIEGADRILATAKRTGSKLFIGHNLRYFPVIAKMKALIEQDVIGDVKAIWCRHFVSYGGDAYFKDWHSEMTNTGGLLLQKGAHDLDIIHWFAGQSTEKVCAMGQLAIYGDNPRRQPQDPTPPVNLHSKAWPPATNTGMSPIVDVEDHNMVLMQLHGGVQASYLQCHFTPDSVRNYTIIGSRGRMENIGDTGACQIAIYNQRQDGYGEPDEVIQIEAIDGSHGGADPMIVADFFNFILDGTPPAVTPLDARNAVAVGVQATQALKQGLGMNLVPAIAPELEQYFLQHQHDANQ